MGDHVAHLGCNLARNRRRQRGDAGQDQAKRFDTLEVSSGAKPLTKLFPTEGDGQPN